MLCFAGVSVFGRYHNGPHGLHAFSHDGKVRSYYEGSSTKQVWVLSLIPSAHPRVLRARVGVGVHRTCR